MEKWDLRFLELAKFIAQWSKDPNTKTGCVIVDDLRRVISVGYNGFPRGFTDDPAMYADRETKYRYVAHCDRNALDNAPCSVRGMTMYLTGNPCTECQKSIVQNGIARVVWRGPTRDFLNMPANFEMLRQAGIEMKEYNVD